MTKPNPEIEDVRPAPSPDLREGTGLKRPRRLVAKILAVAVLLGLALAATRYLGPSIRWNVPEITTSPYGGPAAGMREEAIRSFMALQKSVQEAYDREDRLIGGRRSFWRPQPTLTFHFRELAGGVFELTVTARIGHRAAGDWSGTYTSVDAFLAQADDWGGQIGKELRQRQAGKTR